MGWCPPGILLVLLPPPPPSLSLSLCAWQKRSAQRQEAKKVEENDLAHEHIAPARAYILNADSMVFAYSREVFFRR